MLWVLADDEISRRQLLSGIGVDDAQLLQTTLQRAAKAVRPADPQERAAQVRAWVAGFGGEIG